jgi:hypothetical protein
MTNADDHRTLRRRPRPALLRALGRADVPPTIAVDNQTYQCAETFKHDSWAATALYRSGASQIVVKFNRTAPIGPIGMKWLGRWLARRERGFLQRLEDVRGVPRPCGDVYVEGRVARNAAARRFIEGHPLKLATHVADEFFPRLQRLLADIHAHDIAYVDLHKAENILVASNGQPYLFDWQISARLPSRGIGGRLLRMLQQTDRYHVARHMMHFRKDLCDEACLRLACQRPWWIRAHRLVARPLRQMRRRLLTMIGVRGKSGKASTEACPEVAHRKVA